MITGILFGITFALLITLAIFAVFDYPYFVKWMKFHKRAKKENIFDTLTLDCFDVPEYAPGVLFVYFRATKDPRIHFLVTYDNEVYVSNDDENSERIKRIDNLINTPIKRISLFQDRDCTISIGPMSYIYVKFFVRPKLIAKLIELTDRFRDPTEIVERILKQ